MTQETAAVRDETTNYYYYLRLIKAGERIRAFQSAVRSSVRDGDVVVEIGAGLGTYSLFAAQAGARQVYGIEKGNVAQVAREIAASNGLGKRIAFLQADSLDVTLPERADVLILEDFSSLFLRRGLEEIVRDALQRHLKPGGLVIPHAVSMYVAPVEDEPLWRSLRQSEDERQLYGLDLGVLGRIMLHSPHVRRIEPGALLASPRKLKTLQLQEPQSYLFDEIVAVRAARSGTMHGVAGWFDLEVAKDVFLSNAPGNAESVWRQVVFPFPTPIDVREGESLVLRLACARSSGTRDIWWSWQGAAASGSAHNSSFQGIPLGVADGGGQLDTLESPDLT